MNTHETIRLIPGESIGPLKLGMSPDEILNALESIQFQWPPKGTTPVQVIEDRMFRPDGTRLIRYMNGGSAPVPFFFIVEYKDDHAAEISVNRDLSVVWEQQMMRFVDFFATPADILIPYLKYFSACICGSADEDLGTEYIFPELGLRLWREMAFHPKMLADEAYMESIGEIILDEFKNVFFEIVSVRKIGG